MTSRVTWLGQCPAAVIKPGDTSWDEDRRPINLRMDQHPAVVVDAARPPDVAAVVCSYPVAQQSVPLGREP
jgi:hypothetical protein